MTDNSNNLDDKQLNQQLASITWEIEPERDLWPDISSRIRFDDRRTKRWGPKNWAPIAVAASLTLAVVSLLFSSYTVINTQRIASTQQNLMKYQQAQLNLIEEQHQMVRVQFVQLLEREKNSLNPDFIAEIQQVMSDVDSAAEQIKEAMKTQPSNPDYSSMLVQTYQHELKLLNRVKTRKGLSI